MAVLALALVALFFLGTMPLFILVYIGVFIFAACRLLMTAGRTSHKLLLLVCYLFVLTLQIVSFVHISAPYVDAGTGHIARKLFAVFIILLPLVISRYVAVGKYAQIYLPSATEAGAISFAALQNNMAAIKNLFGTARKARRGLRARNIKAVAQDLPRHDSFRYVNAGHLTPEFFEAAEAALADPSLYIVISDTGSAAADIISVFTRKQFNHASLSFDHDLETIISYNGGANIYPPGLNAEMIEFFHSKPDAGILVYRLPVTREQKRAVLERVREINESGSSYNMLGLIIGKSYKPNIMYCSQFVYAMLKTADAAYFDADNGRAVKPTDFIEKDYRRKLEFVRELNL